MLTDLFIRDFAIIDRLELEFGSGMTVLTGETGAGKSILLDAVKLALGERADSSQVRHGCDRAEVVARFEPDPAAEQLLTELDLDGDDELILRRVVRGDGPSKAYINGSPCPAGKLREVGDMLVEIHGQHEHYLLLQGGRQLAVVDGVAQADGAVGEVAAIHADWRRAREELVSLREDAGLSAAERELLAFQVEELEAWLEDATRIDELHARHKKLAAAQDLSEICARSIDALDGTIGDALAVTGQELGQAAKIDPDLGEARELVESALIHCQEAGRVLSRYQRGVDDAEGVEDLDRRLGRLHELARKHRVEIKELPGLFERLQARLDRAGNADREEARLEARLAELGKRYEAADARLSTLRCNAAKEFSRAVTGLMPQLGMQDGRFEAVVRHDDSLPYAAAGRDRVEFLVSTNPGHPPKPLAKIASGGELSRVGLAIKVAQSSRNERLTLIFDEVDAGIGGAVAEIVGDRLRGLADKRQVFCVTHLPQVASRGHHHLRVTKTGEGLPVVEDLEPDERVQEIARMLGGKTITDRTRAHAQEMLEVE